MEIKKSPQADLERKRGLWLLTGYVVVLSLLYIALEWSSSKPQADTGNTMTETIFEEEIALPEVQLPEPPPLPPAPPETVVEEPLLTEELKILDEASDEEESDLSPAEELAASVQNAPLPEIVQPAADVPDNQPIFDLVEQMPEFANGGLPGLMRYLSRNIRYPATAVAQRIQGQVTVQFIVDSDGSIADATVIQGVDSRLDREALRVIRSMPRWKPGIMRGEPVRVRCTLPVIFRL